MTQEQKDFITNELCPFILREQGRGFLMDEWIAKVEVGKEYVGDGIARMAPVCGTAACIGGSAQFLCRANPDKWNQIGTLGLTSAQHHRLCYQWGTSWPQPFRDDYANAQTPLAKAEVAVALLHKIVETDGAILGDPSCSDTFLPFCVFAWNGSFPIL